MQGQSVLRMSAQGEELITNQLVTQKIDSCSLYVSANPSPNFNLSSFYPLLDNLLLYMKKINMVVCVID